MWKKFGRQVENKEIEKPIKRIPKKARGSKDRATIASLDDDVGLPYIGRNRRKS